MKPRLQQLFDAGQSVWLDNLSRELLTSGDLRRLIEQGVRGVTSNPTIFGKAIAHAHDYDEEIRSLKTADAETVFWKLAIHDIQEALDLFRPLYDSTNGADGFVSLEVSPVLAHDTRATVAMAHDLWKRVDRPNAMIKIPATPEGMPAIEECTAAGININVTLVFSVDMYANVAHAYVKGLQRRLDSGQPIESIASANSVFISRIDTAVDKLLDQKMAHGQPLSYLRGAAGIANVKMAYRRYRDIFYSDEFAAVTERGGRPQRPLWASTGTKDPTYSDLKYIESIVAEGTINTMPPDTLQAFLGHGTIERDTVLSEMKEATHTLETLAKSGISMTDIARTLQDAGLTQFCESYASLLDAIGEKQKAFDVVAESG